jgi:Immunity protein 52
VLNRYIIKVVWGNRRESIESCAGSMVRTLEGLSQLDPIFRVWQGMKGKARVVINPLDCDRSLQEVGELLEQGVNRRDFGKRSIIEELGFTISLSTPGQGEVERAALSCTCGSFARTKSVSVANVLTVSLPFSGPAFERLSSVDALVNALGILVREWRPDRGAVESSSHVLERVREQGGSDTFVSWMLYLPIPASQVPSLPAPSRVQDMEPRGSVIVVTDKSFDPALNDHVEAAARVQRRLIETGVLVPLPMDSSFQLQT